MQLTIPLSIWQKIMLYAKCSLPNEVTGIGLVELEPKTDDHYRVTKIFLPKQSVNPVFSQFSETGLNEIISDVIAEDVQDAVKLRFRWHSHGNSKVFYSDIDNADIEKCESDWVFNLIVNARGDYCIRFDQLRPIRIRNHPVKLVIDYLDGADIMPIMKDLALNVTVRQLPNLALKGGDKNGTEGLFGSAKLF